MKTIKLILVIFLISGMSLTGKTENPPLGKNMSPYKAMMYKEIRELIDYPVFAREQNIEGFVLVSFSYNTNGKFTVQEANSNNDLLKNYVTSKLEQLDMCTHAKTSDRMYTMRFDFKLL